MGMPITIESSEERVRPENSEVERLICDNSKLLKYTNWKPKYSLKEGISEVIEWMKDPGNLSKYKEGRYNV
jgi:dTDP-glucose 4,6-dehydratase